MKFLTGQYQPSAFDAGIAAMAGQRPLAAGDIITTGTMTDAKPISTGQTGGRIFWYFEGDLSQID